MASAATPDRIVPAAEKGTSLWADAWRRLKRNKLAIAGAISLVLIVLLWGSLGFNTALAFLVGALAAMASESRPTKGTRKSQPPMMSRIPRVLGVSDSSCRRKAS